MLVFISGLIFQGEQKQIEGTLQLFSCIKASITERSVVKCSGMVSIKNAQPAKDSFSLFSYKPPAENFIILLILKMTKDSSSGKDSLFVVNKIKRPGTLKNTQSVAGLSRLPYLSMVFFKNGIAVDSFRYNYPLRERIQNTTENEQGYKDVEIRSREFFIRFQQKESDQLKIYKIGYSDKTELLAVQL